MLAESICCAGGLGHELFGIPALADRLLSSLLHVLGCPLLFEGTAGLLRLGRRSFFWCHGCTLRQRHPFRSFVPQRGTNEPWTPIVPRLGENRAAVPTLASYALLQRGVDRSATCRLTLPRWPLTTPHRSSASRANTPQTRPRYLASAAGAEPRSRPIPPCSSTARTHGGSARHVSRHYSGAVPAVGEQWPGTMPGADEGEPCRVLTRGNHVGC